MKRILALSLSAFLVLGLLLTGCAGGAAAPTPTASPNVTVEPTPPATPASTVQPTADARPIVNLAVLSGPTGIGAAKLMADDKDGLTVNNYHVTVAAANDEVTAKLINGEVDIAAIATNVAANLYHKSDGAIQIAALNTLGVLHILERGDTIKTMSGLKGKTIYATGQGANPEYVLSYLLKESGLTPGGDVDIVWKTAQEVSTLMLTGEAEVCMLPEPAATALIVKSASDSQTGGQIRAALDLTEEWEAVSPDSILTMGCIVVRTSYAAEHPDIVKNFLTEYAASIDYVKTNADAAAELVAEYGIAPSAPIAKLAIPRCNLVCITGTDVRDDIQGYYEVLYAANPAAIGGSIPDDAFYYIP